MNGNESFNSGIKRRAREAIKSAVPTVVIVSCVWFFLSAVIAVLATRVSGYDKAFDELRGMVNTGAGIFNAATAVDFEPGDLFLRHLNPLGGLISIALNICLTVVGAGFSWYCLALARGEKPEWKSLFDGFGSFLKIVWMYILCGIFISLWSLLLFFPGIIAAYRYSMAIYIMRDNPEYGALQCIRESKALMRGKKVDLFILQISFILWLILGLVITIFVGIDVLALWLNAYIGVATAGFYLAAKKEG
ncbi:MAG: DUF975 family protein [Oscillospiraceae bacterium]|nr:DUF975 family protein [Oscillospiraceae bacterium]